MKLTASMKKVKSFVYYIMFLYYVLSQSIRKILRNIFQPLFQQTMNKKFNCSHSFLSRKKSKVYSFILPFYILRVSQAQTFHKIDRLQLKCCLLGLVLFP
jgi:hypothetical protein